MGFNLKGTHSLINLNPIMQVYTHLPYKVINEEKVNNNNITTIFYAIEIKNFLRNRTYFKLQIINDKI